MSEPWSISPRVITRAAVETCVPIHVTGDAGESMVVIDFDSPVLSVTMTLEESRELRERLEYIERGLEALA